MQHTVPTPSTVLRSRRSARRRAVVVIGAAIVAAVALVAVVLASASPDSVALPARPPADARSDAAADVPPAELADTPGASVPPSADDGHIAEGTVVTVADTDLPAIARLNPALLAALREAERDAAAHGIPSLQISSGWRSAAYQQRLLDDAIATYGSAQQAERYVATPEKSRHVTGDAVDIAMSDAQRWLSARGADYGLCQTYANEPWHFELATEPGGVCPEMRADAAS